MPIERHPVQKQNALGIYEHTHIVKSKDEVARPRFSSKLKLIAQPGTTTAQNTEAEAAGDTFTYESVPDLANSFGSNKDLFVRRDGSHCRTWLCITSELC